MTTPTQGKQIFLKQGQSITDATYFVLYGDHDSGSDSKGFMVREGFENAQRSAALLDQCGYRRVELKSAVDMLDN